jgi:hypothetical protein
MIKIPFEKSRSLLILERFHIQNYYTMRIKPLSFIVPALFLVFACKKNSGTTSSGSTDKLRLYIEDLQLAGSGSEEIDSFNVTYDNQNRITSLASPDLRFLYTYSSQSFTLDLYENNALSIHEIAYINSASYVDSTFQYNDTNDTTTEGYAYNGAKLIRLTSYVYSSSGTMVETRDDYTYDNSGNMVKDVQSDGNGNVNQVSTLTYDQAAECDDQPNIFCPGVQISPGDGGGDGWVR